MVVISDHYYCNYLDLFRNDERLRKMQTRLVGINKCFIAIHHPGGTYYNNAGANYCPSYIDIHELAELKPAAESGHWEFACKHMGKDVSFHPVVKTACRKAMDDIRLLTRNRNPS